MHDLQFPGGTIAMNEVKFILGVPSRISTSPKPHPPYWSVPPVWAGETICILGCGPSRNLVDMERLRASGHRVIAINDSFRVAPWADLLYYCDAQWWESRSLEVVQTWGTKQHCAKGIIHQCGMIVTMENHESGTGHYRLRNTGPTGFDPDPSCLRHGSNSGYQAVHLSMHLGVKKIILCGYDMRCVGDQLHAEPRPERQTVAGFNLTLQVMLEKWPSIVEPLAERGIEVLNASPGSALKCWPIVEPSSILDNTHLYKIV